MTAATKQERLLLPTEKEIAKAQAALAQAEHCVAQVCFKILGYARTLENENERPDCEAPTYEAMGRLIAYVEDAEAWLEEINGYVAGVRKNFRNLDEIRIRLALPNGW